MKIFEKIQSQYLSHIFLDTKVYFQQLNSQALDCEINQFNFQVQGADELTEFDSRIVFINSYRFKQDLQNMKANSEASFNLVMQSFNFTFYRAFILPLLLIISLSIVSLLIFNSKLIQSIKAIILSVLIIFTHYIIALLYFKTKADLMVDSNFEKHLKQLISFMYYFISIEYSFLVIILVYCVFHWYHLKSAMYGKLSLEKKS